MAEDIAKKALNINPCARLEDNFAPAGRDFAGRIESRKILEFIAYYNIHLRDSRDTCWLMWLLFGIAIATCACSVRYRSFKHLLGFINGLSVGLHKAQRQPAEIILNPKCL